MFTELAETLRLGYRNNQPFAKATIKSTTIIATTVKAITITTTNISATTIKAITLPLDRFG